MTEPMTTQPTPDQIETARRLATAAAMLLSPEETPRPDWLDDGDVTATLIAAFSISLAELLDSRDDLADGIVSGRYTLAVNNKGTALLEQSATA